MSSTPILESLGLLNVEPAFQRAALRAQQLAAQTGTQLAVWRDGQVVLIAPDLTPMVSVPCLNPEPAPAVDR